ncbi:MAG: alpha/beta fold hydrolase [Lewinella sp.]|uniref:alpha/beta fold hydrolase n=1 Tax=Lewinella sp. TaxID=2004506 RepID=UPI003D6C69B0
MKLSNQHKNDRWQLTNSYFNKLDELATPYQSTSIETSFGDTHIVFLGPSDKPPLVLLHEAQSNAALMIEAFKGLLQDFRVYAIDILGETNLSAPFSLPKTDESYAQWMFELLTRLNIEEGTLVGLEKGGFIAWKSLDFLKNRITRAFLIAPAGVIQKEGSPIEEDYPLITAEEANRITTPLYIIAREGHSDFSGRGLLAYARTIFPSLQETMLLETTEVVITTQSYERITNFIKNQF